MPKFSQSFSHLKSDISMKYDIGNTSASEMPTLGNGTKSIKILL